VPFVHKIKLLLPAPLALPPNSSPVFQVSLSPLSVLCILVVSFVRCTLTLIVSKLGLLFFNHSHIHLPSLCSTINSITYSIICSICCCGFRSAPPAIRKAAIISPMNRVYALYVYPDCSWTTCSVLYQTDQFWLRTTPYVLPFLTASHVSALSHIWLRLVQWVQL